MWNEFLTGVTVRKYLQFILRKNSDARAGTQCAFIERKEQRAASRCHRCYTFTLAIVHCCRLELAFPPRTAGRLLKEKNSERLHGVIDVIPSRLQLFTAADLSSPSHRVPLFTPRVSAPVLNIRMRNYFVGDKFW